MKGLRLLILCLSIIACLCLAVGCKDGESLSAPRGVTVEYESLTLRWSEVTGARIYTVSITGEGAEPTEVELSRSYYSLDSLAPGRYEITVRAEGQGGEASPESKPIEFVRDEENGLVYKLEGDGYTVVDKGNATGVIKIPATYRTRPVTKIGESAFFGCAEVTEIILPGSIEHIGANAFANCSYLERINLPAGLLTIGESAFSGCRMLGGSLVLPDGLTEIPKGAFAYCSSITGISLGKRVERIGDNAFTDMSDLASIELPDSLRVIGGFAFAACPDLTEVAFPEGLVEIGEFAFSKAVGITEITLPDSLEVIGKGAFYHAANLESVTLGKGLRRLGDSAFLETKVYKNTQTNEIYIGNWFVGLADVTQPAVLIREGTVGIADGAMYANGYVSAIELPDSVKYIGSNAFAVSNLVSVVTGGGVEHIGDQAFLLCDSLIDVILGSYDYTEGVIKSSSLKTIGTYAFMNCKKLARIDIPDTVTDIGAYAFRGTEIYNSALTGAVYADNWIVDFNKTLTEEVTVDRGTVGIARYAFYGCTTLKSIKLDGSVKHIGRGAFYGCTSLEAVTFPDALENIPDYAFYNCPSLRITRLPPMLKTIGRSAFYGCGTVSTDPYDTNEDILEIPAGVTHIGDYAFFGCGYAAADAIDGGGATVGIDIILMGDGIEYIGKCAFREFASLRSVRIGGAEQIGARAFYGCHSLTELTVADSLTSIGDKAFYKCDSLLRVSLPDTAESIGSYAFYGCKSLSSVRLGTSLRSIGGYAFYGCVRLSEIYLPVSLEAIGEQAFRACGSLRSLTLGESLATVGAHAFYGCEGLTLYLASAVNTDGWDPHYNSTFLPTVTGCELSPEGYVLSVKGEIGNKFTDIVLNPPRREGYVLIGWSIEDDGTADYPAGKLADHTGERLYAVYTEAEAA